MRNNLQKKQRDEIIRRENALFDLELENQKAKQRARDMGQQERNNIDYIAKTGSYPSPTSNPSNNYNHNKHSGWWAFILAVLVIIVLIVIIVNGKSKGQEEIPVFTTQAQVIRQTQSNNYQAPPSNNQASQSNNSQASQQANGQKTVFNDGCIFPDSSSRYLTKAEIDAIEDADGYTRLELIQFAINELYARHNATFKTERMRQHYANCTWYVDRGIDPESVVFTAIEDYNLKLLIDARREERNKNSN